MSDRVVSILHKYDYNFKSYNFYQALIVSILHKYDYNSCKINSNLPVRWFQFYISTIITQSIAYAKYLDAVDVSILHKYDYNYPQQP